MPNLQLRLYDRPATNGPIATRILDPDNIVVAEIDDPTGITQIDWEVFGVNVGTALLPTITLLAGGTIAEFELPPDATSADGRAYGVRCTVNGGLDAAGKNDPSLVTTFGIYLQSEQENFYPAFCGEEFEFDPVVGWARITPFLSTTVGGGDLSGSVGAARVVGVEGYAIDEMGLPERLVQGRLLARFTTPGGADQVRQIGTSDFGSGQDGDLNITSSDVSMTRDMYYKTITWGVGATGRLITNRFMLRAVVLDMRNAPVNAIIPGTGQSASGTTQGSSPGANGWLPPGQSGVQANTSAGSCTVYHSASGGRAGTSGSSANSRLPSNLGASFFCRGRVPVLPVSGSYFCATAGASPTTGAASGAGAAWLGIKCGALITDGTTPAGAISSKGGDGGNAASTGLSGGGGGGGGVIDIECEVRIGGTVSNLLNCDGGKGGDITNVGVAGYTGEGGYGGRIHATCTTPALVTHVLGSAPGIGQNAGLIGGAAGQCRGTF